MSFIPAQKTDVGAFVPTTNILDNPDSKDTMTLLVSLYQYVTNIANVLNIKQSGYYLTEEFCNSNLLFNPDSSNPNDLRPCFFVAVDLGTVTTGAYAHGVTMDTNTKLVGLRGAATRSSTLLMVPIPFVASTGNIEVTVDGTNVNIVNNSGYTFTSGVVILEYVKI